MFNRQCLQPISVRWLYRAHDSQLMLAAKRLGQHGVGFDKPFDILPVIDAAGIHDKGTNNAVAFAQRRAAFGIDRRRRKMILCGSRYVDDFILGSAKPLDRFLPRRLGNGQHQVRVAQMCELSLIPFRQDRILQIDAAVD